jgi:hypothetical protein
MKKTLNLLILFLVITSNFLLTQLPKNYFIKNLGQWDKEITYALFGSSYKVYTTQEAIYFDYYSNHTVGNNIQRNGNVLKFQIEKAKLSEFTEIGKSEWKINFFFGNNPSNWFKGIYGYERILFQDVLPNIDLVLSCEIEPRYDFIVRPGGDPKQIKITIDGAIIEDCNQQEIIFKTQSGRIITRNLYIYQKNNTKERKINGSFKLINNTTFGFDIDNYDKNKELIIDPLVLSTLVGGSGSEEIIDIAEPSQGTIIVTGWTESENFPTTPGAYSLTHSGGKDIFISMFNIKGSKRQLVYSTFLGGSGNETPVNVLVDDNNFIYIGATTNSNDLPLVNSMTKSSFGLNDAYICKFNPTCDEIIFSTYFGGNKDDILTSIKLANDKGVYLAGYTNSNNLPVTGGAYQSTLKGKNDIFFAKISNTGQTIKTCTYIGGIEDDYAYDMCVTPSEYIYIVGATKSNDFPIFPLRVWYYGGYEYVFESPFDRTYNGNFDGVVIKILGAGGGLEYASFYGGLADDFITSVSYFGTDEKVVFAGKTFKEPSTTTFPLSQTAFQNTVKGSEETFVGSLSNIIITTQYNYTYKSQNLVFSTFIGGSGTDIPKSIKFNKQTQRFYIVGYTNSSNFPIVNNPSGKKQQKYDIYFVSMLNDGSGVTFSDIIGGNGDDYPNTLLINYSGDYYIVGSTNSTNFPIVNPIDSTSKNTFPDGFIIKNVEGTLRLDSPLGYEEYCPRDSIKVKWVAEGFTNLDSFYVEIRPDNSIQWIILDSLLTGTSKSIVIPQNITGKVWIRVSHPRGLISTIRDPIIILEPPKLISFTPDLDSIQLCEGDSISLMVGAKGDRLKYQWYFNNNPISNENDSVLLLNNLSLSNSGTYFVKITGACNPSVESRKISLKIIPETKVLSQTRDTLVKVGSTLLLYVNSKGSDLKYQWYKNDSKLLGETKSTFTISNVSAFDQGVYFCIVEGTCGTDTSDKITVFIDTTTTFVGNPIYHNNFDLQIDEKNIRITVYNASPAEEFNVIIYDILGRKVLTKKEVLSEQPTEIIINISNLSSNFYFINVQSQKKNHIYPFIKKQ